MPLLKDLMTTRRLVRNAYLSRKNGRLVERRRGDQPMPPPGTIKIAVYFADSAVNMYQIRQWYKPLADLATTWPVAIISRSPGAVLRLWDEAPIPALYLRKVADLEKFVHEQDIHIVFYVNQNSRNFQMFRYGRMWHVFINHGESDKVYMTTNQFKAYDYSFVAGDAAVDRLTHKLWNFDMKKRAMKIGRPQADHLAGTPPFASDDRTVVLYAPTWEGDRQSAAYGSIASHGVELVSALLATGRHRVVYRPHPRSGVTDPAYRAANASIIAAIASANNADPTAQHVFDDGPELGWQLALADVAITDISAMVYDRLATGKPLIVTRPTASSAEIDDSGYLGAAEWLDASQASEIVAMTDRVLVDEEALQRLKFWVERHFGDTTPGEATRRFRAAVSKLMKDWDKHSAVHEGDTRGSESDPFSDDDDNDD